MYIQRVADTARLKGAAGSIAKRIKLEDRLNAKFVELMDDKFEKQGRISKKDILGFFKELAPNIQLKISKYKNTVNGSGGFLEYDTPKTEAVKKFNIHIPFTNDTDFIEKADYKTIRSLLHEKGHFFKRTIEPKYIARFGEKNLSEKLNRAQSKFYYNLYQNESGDLNGSTRIDFVENNINKFFKKQACSTQEKIEILQLWRYGLKDESNAIKKGISAEIKAAIPFNKIASELRFKDYVKRLKIGASDKNHIVNFDSRKYGTYDYEEKTKRLKLFVKRVENVSYKATVEDHFFFPQKIELMEKMLAKELTQARAEQKVLVGNNYNM